MMNEEVEQDLWPRFYTKGTQLHRQQDKKRTLHEVSSEKGQVSVANSLQQRRQRRKKISKSTRRHHLAQVQGQEQPPRQQQRQVLSTN